MQQRPANPWSTPTETPFSCDGLPAALARSTGAMIAYFTAGHRIGWANDAFAAWFGVPAEALVGRTMVDVYGERAYAAALPRLRDALAGEHVRYDRLLETPGQPARWISVSLHPHRDAAGSVRGVFACSMEVDELRRTRDALDHALKAQELYLENSPLAVVEWDAAGRIVRWAGQAEAVFGWTAAQALGARAGELALVHPDSAVAFEASHRELGEGRATRNRLLARNLTRDGGAIHCEWFNSAFIDAAGHVQGVLSLAQDVTLRLEAEARLQHAAVHDALTGCHNRQSLMQRLDQALRRAQRSKDAVTLLFIDLDRFKPINDALGHAVGDALLKAIAARLSACVREIDTVARIGGDEFVVLLDGGDASQTPEAVRRRLQGEFARGFEVDGRTLHCGLSIGMARYPEDGSDAAQLLAIADRAMYREKTARRAQARIDDAGNAAAAGEVGLPGGDP